MMLGERTGKRYRLGDRVRIKVMRADIETSKIDFSLVEQESSALDMQRAFAQSASEKKSGKSRTGKSRSGAKKP
jgi:ribonuclease R